MELPKKIEALLFVAGEPLAIKDIARLSDAKKETVEEALDELSAALSGRGIRLLRHEDTLQLVSAPEASDIATRLSKEQLEGDLSRASLETLAIILWKGTASRSMIDYVRGVNSAFALRTLLIRGLIERETDPNDARVFLYRPTGDLCKHMGVTSKNDLPHYEEISKLLEEQHE